MEDAWLGQKNGRRQVIVMGIRVEHMITGEVYAALKELLSDHLHHKIVVI